MGVYLRAKFEFSSLILTSFRHGDNFTPAPPLQNELLKSPPRLGLNTRLEYQALLLNVNLYKFPEYKFRENYFF